MSLKLKKNIFQYLEIRLRNKKLITKHKLRLDLPKWKHTVPPPSTRAPPRVAGVRKNPAASPKAKMQPRGPQLQMHQDLEDWGWRELRELRSHLEKARGHPVKGKSDKCLVITQAEMMMMLEKWGQAAMQVQQKWWRQAHSYIRQVYMKMP